MSDEYPQRVAVVHGGKVKAVATVDSVQEREAYGEERYGVTTWTLAEADSSSMSAKLQVEICEALRASQDAADLAETGRRLMARTIHGSGGAPPDLGGPPAQKPPEPTLQRYDMITTQVGSCMSKRDDGDYVLFEDVEELETANQRLRRDNERLVAQLDSEPWVP